MEYITNFFKPINNFYKTKKNIIKKKINKNSKKKITKKNSIYSFDKINLYNSIKIYRNDFNKNININIPFNKIIIIGLGPVGLYFTNLLQENNIKNFKIYEKRKHYTRTQSLVLQKDVIKLIKKLDNNIFKKVCSMDCPPFKQRKIVCGKKKLFVYLPVNELEEKLYSLLNKNTIKKIKIKAKGRDELLKLLKKEDGALIINCSGRCLYKCPKYEKTLNFYQFGFIVYINNYSDNISDKEKCGAEQHKFRGFTNYKGNIYLAGVIRKRKVKNIQVYNLLNTLNVGKIDKKIIEKHKVLENYIKKMFEFYNLEYTKKYNCEFFKIQLKYNKPYIKKHNNLILNVGDSAFSSHFFSGQGINSGIREAHKLFKYIMNYKNFKKNYEQFVIKERTTRYETYFSLI